MLIKHQTKKKKKKKHLPVSQQNVEASVCERRRRNQVNTDLLYDAVQGLRAADVKTDENCIRVGVGQRSYIVVVGGAC